MTISIPGRVVVFDYGEVISRSPSEADRARIVELAGVDSTLFWPVYWADRNALDRGTLSVSHYWGRLADALGVEWSAVRVHELWIADFRSWFSLEPGTLELIEQLHDGGTRLALLSNAGFDFAGPFRAAPMARFFEHMFVSAEMDAIKPDPAIYLEVAAQLGIDATEMVFVDNKAENTDAASALGITAHHFTGVDGLAAFLRGLASRS